MVKRGYTVTSESSEVQSAKVLQNLLEGLLKWKITGPTRVHENLLGGQDDENRTFGLTSRVSDSLDQGWGPRTCLSIMVSDDADAAGPRNVF